MPPKKRQPTKKKTEEVEEMQVETNAPVETQPVKRRKNAKVNNSEEVPGAGKKTEASSESEPEDEVKSKVAARKRTKKTGDVETSAGKKAKASPESEVEENEVKSKVAARKRTNKTQYSDAESDSLQSDQEEKKAEPRKKISKLQPMQEEEVKTEKKATKSKKKGAEEGDKKSKASEAKKDKSDGDTDKKNKETKVEKKESKKPVKAKKDEPAEKPTKKKIPAKRKTKEEKEDEEEKETVNTSQTNWSNIDFKCNKKNKDGNVGNFLIITWNVDGMRAWLKKGGLNILKYASPDVLCLQETKCSLENVPSEIGDFEGYEKYWCSSKKNGYAGVALLSKIKPIEVTFGIGDEEQDEDGRCITAEYDKFFLVTVYVPNAGRKLVTLDKRLEWNEIFKNYVKNLDEKKPVIICGDLNVAHNEIDLTNPKTNQKNAGFTQEERDGMTDFLEQGFLDTFRAFYPDKENCFTFWSYMSGARKKNIGWRLDYFLVSENLQSKVCDNVIHNEVYGSDHCPSTLFIHI